MISLPAMQAAIQAVKNICVCNPRLGDRIGDRIPGGDHGHRRRLFAGADADLFAPRADRDCHWHLDGAHAGHDGLGDSDACRHKSSGGCGAGADPDGWRGHWRAIRCAYRAEDARRTTAAVARTSGFRGGLPICLRAGGRARRSLFASLREERMMRRLAQFLVFTLLVFGAEPAAAERLVVSLSNHRVAVTSNFVGEELVLFGTIEPEPTTSALRPPYDLVVTVTGPRQTIRTRRKQRIVGIWVNADSREFVRVPAYLAVLSNRPVNDIANPDTLRRLQIGLDNFLLPQRIGSDVADTVRDDPFRRAFVRLQTQQGLYRESRSEERRVGKE